MYGVGEKPNYNWMIRHPSKFKMFLAKRFGKKQTTWDGNFFLVGYWFKNIFYVAKTGYFDHDYTKEKLDLYIEEEDK